MSHPSASSQDHSSLSELSGFAPIDESPEHPPHDRRWRWGRRCAVCFGCTGLAIGAFEQSWPNAVGAGAMLAVVGLLIGWRLGRLADREASDAEVRSDCARKDEEDRVWLQKLAEAQLRANDAEVH